MPVLLVVDVAVRVPGLFVVVLVNVLGRRIEVGAVRMPVVPVKMMVAVGMAHRHVDVDMPMSIHRQGHRADQT